jgi:hypothetical protein
MQIADLSSLRVEERIPLPLAILCPDWRLGGSKSKLVVNL